MRAIGRPKSRTPCWESRETGLPVHVIHLESAYDRQGPRRLGELFTRHGIRLAHVQGYKAAVNTALAAGDFSMVSTLHGQGEPNWRRPREFVKDQVYRTLEAWACRRRRAAVCFVTADLQRRHGWRYGSLAQSTVCNGIAPLDPGNFPTRPAELVPDRLHALMVGRLTPVKGIPFAMEALASLAPDVPWQLNLVGEGEERGDLEDVVGRFGLRDRVAFHGFRRDIFALMAHSDLLIMSSLHEGLPYTLLEAMSLGLPTLASDVGGLAEVLSHEETGLLVPVGDVDSLASALQRLGRDGELRSRLGANAAREQRRAYTLRAMGEGYLSAYGVAAGTRA